MFKLNCQYGVLETKNENRRTIPVMSLDALLDIIEEDSGEDIANAVRFTIREIAEAYYDRAKDIENILSDHDMTDTLSDIQELMDDLRDEESITDVDLKVVYDYVHDIDSDVKEVVRWYGNTEEEVVLDIVL